MSLESDKYFCWILPNDDNIDFWSTHFNEYVYRLMSEWKILKIHAEKFLAAEKWFPSEILSSTDWFRRKEEAIRIMH